MATIYTRDPDVVFRKIADEFVLVPIRRRAVDLKSVYTLNAVGAFVWEQIDGSRDAACIAGRVADEFDVDPARAEKDVAEILTQFTALGLTQ